MSSSPPLRGPGRAAPRKERPPVASATSEPKIAPTAEPVVGAPTPPIGVLERGIAVLECFSPSRLRLSLRDFAELTGLDKATLLRLLGVLINARMAQRLASGEYTLGPALLHMGMLYRSSVDLGSRLQPLLQAVVQQTGETVAFYVRSGSERVCLYREHSQSEVRPHVEPGMRLQLSGGGASAHILLYCTGGQTPLAAHIAEHGYAITRAERVPEMASIAVPVFDGDGSFAGALVVIGVASRQSREAQLAALDVVRAQLHEQGFSSWPPAGWSPPA